MSRCNAAKPTAGGLSGSRGKAPWQPWQPGPIAGKSGTMGADYGMATNLPKPIPPHSAL